MIIICEGLLELSDEKSNFCSHCGTIVKSDDVFCNNCGASLEDTIEPIGDIPVQQDLYTQTTYPTPATVYVSPPQTLNSVAIIALIFGIISVVSNLFPIFFNIIGIISAVISIITGIIGGLKSQKKYMSFIGLGLGVLGIALYLLTIFGLYRFWGFWW